VAGQEVGSEARAAHVPTHDINKIKINIIDLYIFLIKI
jgi:hypothetical protein